MSKLYDRSISPDYRRYFASYDEIQKNFSHFTLSEGKVSIASAHKHPWETNFAGVPIAWNSSLGMVSVDQTDSHTLVIGPTGSKKSRLVIMPQVRILGSEQESMIICDPKAEIYSRTGEYLKNKGYQILVLNLRSPERGCCWNPLSIPYQFYLQGETDKAYEFINDIAQNLVHTEQSNSDPFWDNSAGSFFFGLVALLFKFCKDHEQGIENIHIGNVIKLRNELFSGSVIDKKRLWDYAKQDPIIGSSLIGTVEAPNDTRQSILSVFDQKVRMFSLQQNLMDVLATNEIDFETISEKPTAIFLLVPDEKTGFHGLVSLFVKQSYEYLIYKAQRDALNTGSETGKLKRRVNYILDEFSSLPTIHDFPAMITAARSRNIRFTLVVQSLHQIIKHYKDEAETLKTNCNNWIFLTSRELSLLEELSTLCGKINNSGSRPLITVTALQRLDKDAGEALVLVGRNKPFVTRLPDIEKYDGNKFSFLPLTETKRVKSPTLDFRKLIFLDQKKQFESMEEWKSHLDSNFPSDRNEYEELIAKIDKRIAELRQDSGSAETEDTPASIRDKKDTSTAHKKSDEMLDQKKEEK